MQTMTCYEIPDHPQQAVTCDTWDPYAGFGRTTKPAEVQGNMFADLVQPGGRRQTSQAEVHHVSKQVEGVDARVAQVGNGLMLSLVVIAILNAIVMALCVAGLCVALRRPRTKA